MDRVDMFVEPLDCTIQNVQIVPVIPKLGLCDVPIHRSTLSVVPIHGSTLSVVSIDGSTFVKPAHGSTKFCQTKSRRRPLLVTPLTKSRPLLFFEPIKDSTHIAISNKRFSM